MADKHCLSPLSSKSSASQGNLLAFEFVEELEDQVKKKRASDREPVAIFIEFVAILDLMDA